MALNQIEPITTQQLDAKGVVSAPTVLTGTPAENKAIFDRLVRELMAPVINQVIADHNEIVTSEQGRVTAEASREEAEAARRETVGALVQAAGAARDGAVAAQTAAEQAQQGAEDAHKKALSALAGTKKADLIGDASLMTQLEPGQRLIITTGEAVVGITEAELEALAELVDDLVDGQGGESLVDG